MNINNNTYISLVSYHINKNFRYIIVTTVSEKLGKRCINGIIVTSKCDVVY